MKTEDTRGRLSSGLLILIFIVLAGGISTAGHFFYSDYEKNYRTQVDQQISAISDLKSRDIVQWRKERLGDANQLFGNSAFSSLAQRYIEHPDDTDAKEQLSSWLSHYFEYYQYSSVLLLDTSGAARIIVPDAAAPVPHHVAKDAQGVLQSGKLTFLDLHIDEASAQPNMGILIPIYNQKDDNTPTGVVLMRIDPYRYLYPLISRWPTPSATAETLIVRRDGDYAVYLNELKYEKDAALKLRIPIEKQDVPAVKAVLGQEGIIEGIDYRGQNVIADIRRIPDSPWFMVARIDTSEVYAPLTQMLWVIIALVGSLLIGAGAAVGLIWRWQNIRAYKDKAAVADSLKILSSRQEALLAAVPDIIAEVDENKVYTWANRAATDFFGEDVIGKAAAFYFEGEQDTYGIVQPIFKGDENVIYVESWQRRADGERRLLAWWCRVLKDKDGKVTGALSSAQDITERELAEKEIRRLNTDLEQRVQERTAQLEAANNELEAFAYSVSHDLRGPLRGIDGWSLALLQDCKDKLGEKESEYLGLVRSETQTMGRLIDDLLNFSRQSRAEMSQQRLDMTAMARAIVSRLQRQNPTLRTDFIIQPGLTAFGDSALIDIALTNLLDNAVKFSSKSQHAVVEFGQVEKDGRKAFFVRDNGVGFDMAYAHKLFGVFRRLHKSSEFPGTGIGLASVQRIISRHLGLVWAEAGVNRGATFYFTLKEAA